MKTTIVILAAGSSSRMGEPKQLLPFGNTTLLGNAIEIAQQSNADSVVCVLGANYEAIKKSIEKYAVEVVFNPNFNGGLSTSIVSVVEHLKDEESLLFMLADQPKITVNFLNELLRLQVENPQQIVASSYGKNVGVPAVFPKQTYQDLLQLKGDKGAREYLNSEAINIITIKSNNLIDIDTPENYRDFLANN